MQRWDGRRGFVVCHGDRIERTGLMFALCSQLIRLGGFFMKFRGRNAHPNRVERTGSKEPAFRPVGKLKHTPP